MQKKNSRVQQRSRQRQKLNRRTIIILAASCMTCMVIALTIFFQTSHVEESMAAVSIYTVVDEIPTVEKTLDAPVIRQMPVIGPNTMQVRTVRTELQPEQNHHN